MTGKTLSSLSDVFEFQTYIREEVGIPVNKEKIESLEKKIEDLNERYEDAKKKFTQGHYTEEQFDSITETHDKQLDKLKSKLKTLTKESVEDDMFLEASKISSIRHSIAEKYRSNTPLSDSDKAIMKQMGWSMRDILGNDTVQKGANISQSKASGKNYTSKVFSGLGKFDDKKMKKAIEDAKSSKQNTTANTDEKVKKALKNSVPNIKEYEKKQAEKKQRRDSIEWRTKFAGYDMANKRQKEQWYKNLPERQKPVVSTPGKSTRGSEIALGIGTAGLAAAALGSAGKSLKEKHDIKLKRKKLAKIKADLNTLKEMHDNKEISAMEFHKRKKELVNQLNDLGRNV